MLELACIAGCIAILCGAGSIFIMVWDMTTHCGGVDTAVKVSLSGYALFCAIAIGFGYVGGLIS